MSELPARVYGGLAFHAPIHLIHADYFSPGPRATILSPRIEARRPTNAVRRPACRLPNAFLADAYDGQYSLLGG